jgi:exonuclease SbcD
MRILHTSDWHPGRALCGERLLDDQAYVLNQLTRIADDFHPDAVLVAGDVYVRAIPAPDAVQLVDDVVTLLVLDRGIHVFLIAGNHNNGTRLGFGARLLARGKLHLIGSLREGSIIVVLPDDHGDVAVCTVPYAEPMLAADELDCPSICDHDTAMRAAPARSGSARTRPRHTARLAAGRAPCGHHLACAELRHQIHVGLDVTPCKRGRTAHFVVPGLGSSVESHPRAIQRIP